MSESDEPKVPGNVEACYKEVVDALEEIVKRHGLKPLGFSLTLLSPKHPDSKEHRGKEWIH